MRVLLKTMMAGPAGSHQPGVVDFPEKTARELIAGGYAESVPADEAEKSEMARRDAPERETADAPQPETADAPEGELPARVLSSARRVRPQ